MVKQHGKRPRKNIATSNHQTNWLWGEHLVIDTLAVGRWRAYELFVSSQLFEKYAELLQKKQSEGVEIEVVLHARLDELSRTTDHQGIVARVSTYPYMPVDEFAKSLKASILLEQSNESKSQSTHPVVVIMDRVQDAFTFGAILRCCQASKVAGVIIGEYCQAQVTPQIARSSFGAVNHFPVVKTDDVLSTTQIIKETGFNLVALDQRSEQSISTIVRNAPTGLIIGSDVHEIDPLLMAQCSQRLSIPSNRDSIPLNSAVVTGVLLYEIGR